MIKFNDVTKENIKEHNHPYRIIIIQDSGS